MKKRDYRDYLQDIIDSINDIETFIKNMTYEDFSKDRKTINAVVRSIEIIGEAVKNLTISFRNKHPSIPWKKMAGMRDKLAHEYSGIDLAILWSVMKEDVPSLKPAIKQIFNEIEKS